MSRTITQKKTGSPRPTAAPGTPGVFRGPTVNETKLALLITFLSILVKGNIHYCEPFPDTTLELLQKYHNIEIGRRWFFQCMQDLETSGFMRRQRRWLLIDGPEIRSTSSLWWFTIKGIKYLSKKSIQGARKLLRIMTTWLKKDDDRHPRPVDLASPGEEMERSAALNKVKQLLRDIG